MKTIEIYDPELGNRGNGCGSGSDREALRMRSMLQALTKEGKNVLRYGLIENPDVFALNKEVSEIIAKKGSGHCQLRWWTVKSNEQVRIRQIWI